MKLHLETLFIKIEKSQVIYWSNQLDISESKQDPDNILENILRHKKENYILHSTSWRYEKPDKIILTYLIYSDEMDFENNPTKRIDLSELRLAFGKSHKKPRPEDIQLEHVLAHAIRHLAFLAETDKKLLGQISAQTRKTLAGVAPVLGGRF